MQVQPIYLSRGQLRSLNILYPDNWWDIGSIHHLIWELERENPILMLDESLDKLTVNQYYRYKGYFTVSERNADNKSKDEAKDEIITITTDYSGYTIILGCSAGSFMESSVTYMFLRERMRTFLDTIFLILDIDGERIIGNPFSIVLDLSQPPLK